MIRATTFAGRMVAVFGLGASGTATALSLLAGSATVAAWDDGAASREAAAKAGVPIVDLNGADWSRFAALVLAPGVPLTHPEPHWTVARARAANVEVIGDIEIFCRERAAHCPDAPFIAITGTNGKSTTTALIAHILSSAGLDVQMGGNIGRAILTLEPPAEDRVHVIEMSSFQIDLTPGLKPSIGVLLNITPDHLDRHGPADDADLAMRNYAAIKQRLVANAGAACAGVEDAPTRAILEKLEDAGIATYAFTTGKGAAIVPRLYAIGTSLFLHEVHNGGASSSEIATLDGIGTLRGRHNAQNALAALAALRALQDRLDGSAAADDAGRLHVWNVTQIKAALATYPGLPHRMEEVGRLGRVLFINDSKATNADSTEKALAAFASKDGPRIFWILGGKAKEGGIAPLEPHFPGIARAYLIGAATEDFAATLEGKVEFIRCGTLDAAVAAASADAFRQSTTTALRGNERSHPIVLLSPACASYDQFKSFEHRGDAFRAMVLALPGVAAKGQP